jgi:hypothetical protein
MPLSPDPAEYETEMLGALTQLNNSAVLCGSFVLRDFE